MQFCNLILPNERQCWGCLGAVLDASQEENSPRDWSLKIQIQLGEQHWTVPKVRSVNPQSLWFYTIIHLGADLQLQSSEAIVQVIEIYSSCATAQEEYFIQFFFWQDCIHLSRITNLNIPAGDEKVAEFQTPLPAISVPKSRNHSGSSDHRNEFQNKYIFQPWLQEPLPAGRL